MNTWLWFALLENGTAIEHTGRYGEPTMHVGDFFRTQWGERRVLSVYRVIIDNPDTPYEC